MDYTAKCGLNNLPVELLYEIQIYSQWHMLPLASKRLYHIFKSAPSSVRAEYLISRHLHASKPESRMERISLVSKALRFPICTQVVLDLIMLRMPSCPPTCMSLPTELPRRLFRSLSSRPTSRFAGEHLLPFLRFLFSHPKFPPPDPNSWEGYALTKAVAAGSEHLVRFLLENGASPRYKHGIAVHVAIRQKNLPLVKLLIEPDSTVLVQPDDDAQGSESQRGPRGKRRSCEEALTPKKSAKKRRLDDRVEVNSEMLKAAVVCGAQDIAKYFMYEKACTPDMQTIKLMQG